MPGLLPPNYEAIIKEFSRTHYEVQLEIGSKSFSNKEYLRFSIGSKVVYSPLVVYEELFKEIDVFVMLRL
jgi:hypothetical protein